MSAGQLRQSRMGPIRIRRGAAADAPALAASAARTFHETFAADNRPEDMAAHLASSFGVAQQAHCRVILGLALLTLRNL